MDLYRRDVLTGAALLAGSALIPRAAIAAGGRDRRLVVVMLRGGMDGLATIMPVGDSAFADLRPSHGQSGTLPLDGLFHAHPALKTLAAMVASKEAIVFHATASPYRGRSHFDGQEVLESGLAREGVSHLAYEASSHGLAQFRNEAGRNGPGQLICQYRWRIFHQTDNIAQRHLQTDKTLARQTIQKCMEIGRH